MDISKILNPSFIPSPEILILFVIIFVICYLIFYGLSLVVGDIAGYFILLILLFRVLFSSVIIIIVEAFKKYTNSRLDMGTMPLMVVYFIISTVFSILFYLFMDDSIDTVLKSIITIIMFITIFCFLEIMRSLRIEYSIIGLPIPIFYFLSCYMSCIIFYYSLKSIDEKDLLSKEITSIITLLFFIFICSQVYFQLYMKSNNINSVNIILPGVLNIIKENRKMSITIIIPFLITIIIYYFLGLMEDEHYSKTRFKMIFSLVSFLILYMCFMFMFLNKCDVWSMYIILTCILVISLYTLKIDKYLEDLIDIKKDV